VILQVKELTKIFGVLYAVDNVSFGIDRGDLVGLIGPNGAGKTTLFNLITGFLTPEAGRFFLKEKILLTCRRIRLLTKKWLWLFKSPRFFRGSPFFRTFKLHFSPLRKGQKLFFTSPQTHERRNQ